MAIGGPLTERIRSIQVSVEPFYADDQSAPEQNRFVFGYRLQDVRLVSPETRAVPSRSDRK